MKVTNIHARIIFDSRGFPTLEAECTLNNNFKAHASVPSGASTGKNEALELRDGDENEFMGKGVSKALDNFNSHIKVSIENKTFNSQEEFDNFLIELDGTKNKSNLGANAILAASLSFAKASAKFNRVSLYKIFGNNFSTPKPMMNIVNGGVHADNTVEIQEFMIIPNGFSSFFQAMKIGSEIFHNLKGILNAKGYSTNVGDEGGFAPNLENADQVIELILEACEKANYTPGKDVNLALDCASSEFYKNDSYFPEHNSKALSANELVEFYGKLINQYPIISIEDPFEESDYEGWKEFTKIYGHKLQIVGDDLYVTNPDFLEKGISSKLSNAILIKPNQIGTLTETLKTIKLAQENSFKTIISHRSGETEDTTISHIAVGTNAGQIKTGSLCRSDRMAKYNELLRIEEEL